MSELGLLHGYTPSNSLSLFSPLPFFLTGLFKLIQLKPTVGESNCHTPVEVKIEDWGRLNYQKKVATDATLGPLIRFLVFLTNF